MLHGTCIEQWTFKFGFVIPDSTNNWQQIIRSAGKNNMMSPDILSGNVTIDTNFYDGDVLIFGKVVRIYYI